jgi:hypothetical protein
MPCHFSGGGRSAFCQTDRQRLDADLAGARAHQRTRHADEVAQVEIGQPLEALAERVLAQERLHAARAIAQVGERRLAHVPHGGDAPRHAHDGRFARAAGRLPPLERFDGVRRGVRALRARRVRVDAARAQAIELLATDLDQFVFTGHARRVLRSRGLLQRIRKEGGRAAALGCAPVTRR